MHELSSLLGFNEEKDEPAVAVQVRLKLNPFPVSTNRVPSTLVNSACVERTRRAWQRVLRSAVARAPHLTTASGGTDRDDQDTQSQQGHGAGL